MTLSYYCPPPVFSFICHCPPPQFKFTRYAYACALVERSGALAFSQYSAHRLCGIALFTCSRRRGRRCAARAQQPASASALLAAEKEMSFQSLQVLVLLVLYLPYCTSCAVLYFASAQTRRPARRRVSRRRQC